MTYILIYGTIKRGRFGHDHIYQFVRTGEAEYMGEKIVDGYRLNLGNINFVHDCPFMVPDPDGQIMGEVYRVTDNVLDYMDDGESWAYDRLKVGTFQGHDLFAYVARKEIGAPAGRIEY